jgi:uncharacterized protein (TIGR02996 family)
MEESGFLQAIADNWDDDVARLVYADWLEERGDVRGEFLRLECRLAKRSPGDRRCRRIRDRLRRIARTQDPHWLRSVCRVRDTWGLREKLQEVVSHILAGFTANPPRDRWERRLSEWLGAIPMGSDGAGAYIMLHPDGHLTYVLLHSDAEEDWHCSTDEEPVEMGYCLRKARRRYPELWAEMERLGAELPDCPTCGRKGRRAGRVCDVCGGLGWVADVGL